MALPAEPFAERCRRAAAAAASLGVDRLLASDHGSVRWLTGRESEIGWGPLYPISAGTHVLLDLDGGGRIFCAEGEEEAGPAIDGLQVVTYPGYTVTPLRAYTSLKQLLNGGGRLAVEAHALPIALAPSAETVDAAPALASLRRRKDPAEIARIERAARVASVGQRTFRACAEPGKTEIEVFSALHAAMEKEAGTRVPVLPDLISGPRMALVGVRATAASRPATWPWPTWSYVSRVIGPTRAPRSAWASPPIRCAGCTRPVCVPSMSVYRC